MGNQPFNWLAVLTAAISAFVLGALWYSPLLFGKVWMRSAGVTPEQAESGAGKVFTIAFLFELVMACNLAMFLNDPGTTVTWGATAGFLAGVGWIALGVGVISLFERRPWSYMLVNGGYMGLSLTVMGAILGAWR
jgi:hypothetical protein